MDIKTLIFDIGTRVHCGLYGGKDGIVFKIDGEQRPETVRDLLGGAMVTGGNANLHIVFDDHISVVPECIVRGVQWRLSRKEGLADADEVELALTRVAGVTAKAERQSHEKSERRAIERASLPERYPYLKTLKDNVGKSSHAIGASNIRMELKRAFSGFKFSVRSDCFSGGDSIRVSWTDGPTVRQIEKITSKYSKGSFNGMDDLYSYKDTEVWTDVFGGGKYVFESRDYSEALLRQAAEQAGVAYQERYSDYQDQERVNRKAAEISLLNPVEEPAAERDHDLIPLPDEFASPLSVDEAAFMEGFKK